MVKQKTSDQSASEREPFEWGAWLEEGMRGLRILAEDVGVPPAFLEHSCAAKREARLAMKTLFNEMGDCLGRMGEFVASNHLFI